MDGTTPYVIGQSGDCVAIYKPAQYLVHPVGHHDAPDVMSWLQHSPCPAAQPVHRLDLGVSGVVLCALSLEARRTLGHALETRKVSKEYWALVRGHTRSKGTIRRPLKDARRKTSLEAVTRYTRLAQFSSAYSLLCITLETGRKHQIRRHLEGLNHPIVGDRRYRGRRKAKGHEITHRIWLHARMVTLPNGVVFEAPLPSDLEDDLAALRTRHPAIGAE